MFPDAAIKDTVQDFEREDSVGIPRQLLVWGRDDIIPAYGRSNRDFWLRWWYRNPYNALVQGAFTGLIKRVASTPIEVKGNKDKPRLVKYYQDLLVSAHFGEYGGGWRGFIMRLLLDFLTQDFGGVCEIIGGGDPMKPLKGNVLGIAQLDAQRCVATGNPEYPIIYWSRRSNKMHRLHHTRVARFVDMPDGDEWAFGSGLCAMSRVISIVKMQELMSKYLIQRLDDLPPAGLLLLNNITEKKWKDVQATYTAEQKRDGNTTWANVAVLLGLDPANPISADFVPFASTPEHFDYKQYTDIQVNAIALTLGVDPQDIWPLTGSAIGTATQSGILASKGRGKMLADIYQMLEQFINWYILPPELEMAFKYSDTEADKEQADLDLAYTQAAQNLRNMSNNETALQYLSNVRESFKDVLIDESGQLIELGSDDPKEDEQLESNLQTIPETQAPPTGQSPATVSADGDTPLVASGKSRSIGLRHTSTRKDIQATRLDFEADASDLFKAAMEDEIARRRFGTVFRGMIRKYGQKAYEDGLVSGGVEDAPDSDDLATIADIAVEQSAYVTSLGDAIFVDETNINDYEAKARLWWNKSIMPFNYAGIESADANGLYEFAGDDGADSCDTCQRLSGQVHRMKDWVKKQLRPGQDTDNFDCGGYRCNHSLVKTRGRARGSY